MRALKIFLILLASQASACEPKSENSQKSEQFIAAQSSRDVSNEDLFKALQSGNLTSIIKLMNEIKTMQHQGGIIKTLDSIWNSEGASHYPSIANSPRVRIEIADVLIQAWKNGRKDLNKDAYLSYARKLVSADDTDVAIQAILVLGAAGESDDVLLISNLIKEEEINTFRAATYALAKNCHADTEIYEGIRRTLQSPALSEIMSETWSNNLSIREYSCRK